MNKARKGLIQAAAITAETGTPATNKDPVNRGKPKTDVNSSNLEDKIIYQRWLLVSSC